MGFYVVFSIISEKCTLLIQSEKIVPKSVLFGEIEVWIEWEY